MISKVLASPQKFQNETHWVFASSRLHYNAHSSGTQGSSRIHKGEMKEKLRISYKLYQRLVSGHKVPFQGRHLGMYAKWHNGVIEK